MSRLDVSEIMAEAKDHYGAGRLDEAERLYAGILERDSEHPDALHLLGLLNHQRGRLEVAVDLISRALGVAPDLTDARSNLGVVQMAAGDLDDAVGTFDRVIARTPEDAEAHFNRGNALRGLRRSRDAIAAYEHAVGIEPRFAEAHTNLGAMRKAAGDGPGALAAFQRAAHADPTFAPAVFNLGVAAQEAGDLARAHTALLEAARLAPEMAHAHYHLGITCRALGLPDEAQAAFRRSTGIRPDFVEAQLELVRALEACNHPDTAAVRSNLGTALLVRGDPAGALRAYDINLRARAPAPGEAPPPVHDLAHKAVALRELGRTEAATGLADHARLLRVRRIETPPAYRSIDAFNRALANHVLQHPTLAPDPTGHSTRRGRQTGELLVEPMGPMAAFESIIDRLVHGYIDELTPNSSHPYLAYPPSRWRLTIWGVVLGACGHQVPHIHPDGWLSGNYYVQIPEAVRSTDTAAGWLEFGRPDPRFACTAEPDIEVVRPVAGTVVLFPSYFYHCTIPFEDEQPRISIAFDAMPIDNSDANDPHD